MLHEFVIIDCAIGTAGKAVTYSKLRVNLGAIVPQRKLCRITKPISVSSV